MVNVTKCESQAMLRVRYEPALTDIGDLVFR